ncbi:MAG TPA: TIR domain-containing protein [Steroidobacteraceae bacterium]
MDEAGQSGTPHGAQAPGQQRRVFISYASHDATIAQNVCSSLEAGGYPCWIAPRDVVPGTLYADGIIGAINDTTILVLILSAQAAASAHVGKEVERASSKRHPIIVLRTDTAPLNRAFEYFLSESQWIEVSDGGIGAATARLLDAVAQHLSPGSALPPAPLPPVRTTAISRRVSIAVGVFVVPALLATYLLVDKPWLHSHAAVTTPIADKSIAVLPFVDMSEKKDQEYFGDGMAEDILDLLAKIPGLNVVGRTSSFQFKGRNEDLRTIGAQLNSAYVLEGSVRNSGGQVRVTAQLIDTRTGTHEWSETYDRPIGDVLKLQDAIAAAVVRELQLTVTSEYLKSRATSKNAEAYDLYLRGRHSVDSFEKEGLDEGVVLFQQALDHDPAFADAAAMLARTYMAQVFAGYLAPVAGVEQARRTASAALKLDPTNVLAHVTMAQIHEVYDWDWAGAQRELQHAATLAPSDADVLGGEAELSEALGRWDDALRQIKAALAKDPINPSTLSELFGIQWSRGHFPEAEAAERRVMDIRPSFGYGHYNLGLLLLMRGAPDTALLEMQQESIDDAKQKGLAMVYHALGRKAESDAALAGMIQKLANADAIDIADVYAFRGESDESMRWLERAYAQKSPFLSGIKGDHSLKRLGKDSRYQALLKKMNFPDD